MKRVNARFAQIQYFDNLAQTKSEARFKSRMEQ
jgi:hypothetical protein